jgi:cell wall-associated NlpC family hydrolase
VIAEIGLAKILAAGGGLAGTIALFAGVSGSQQYAATDQAASVCAYVQPGPQSAPERTDHMKQARELRLTAEQLANAQVILDTAHDLGLPGAAAVIGIATALQESSLKNDVIGDKGRAFGVFQQHPADGWGARNQVTNPRYAARAFFIRLAKVKGWEKKPLTVVAQAVQRSGLPNAYAKHEDRANAIVSALDQAKAAQGIRRADLINAISRRLREQSNPRDRRRRRGQEIEKSAEAIVQDLCDEVTAEIGSIAAGAGSAVQAALAMRGVPYSWGGGGPSGPSYGFGRGAGTKGFDCSGLTEYAWAQAGVHIGSTTYQQVSAGAAIPRADVQPGDLVFYETDPTLPGPDHVGLAVSNTHMINAPYTGAVVRIDPIDRPGWAGAIRPRIAPAMKG